MDAKEFKMLLRENEELSNQYHEIFGRLTAEKVDRLEACLKAAAEVGYELDAEDVRKADKIEAEPEETQELSENELENVSGGIWGYGEIAPDGHEVSCLATYWTNWLEFEESWRYTYCKGTHGKQKHILGPVYWGKHYAFSGEMRIRKCALCGATVPMDKTWSDKRD